MQWKLFANLAEIAGERTISITTDADATVGDALDVLLERHPSLRDEVLVADGELHDHINLLVNGTNIHTLSGLETPIEPDDELALFPPVSGG